MQVVNVKSEHIETALVYAACSFDWTYRRMGNSDSKARFNRIKEGIIVEQAVVDLLRGLKAEVDDHYLSTNWREPDRGDILLGGQRVDIKGLRTRVADPWALVPVDQFARNKKDIYIFAFYDWDNAVYPFAFATSPRPVRLAGQSLPDGKRVKIAVFDSDAGSGTIHTARSIDGSVRDVPDRTGSVNIDAVLVFADDVTPYALRVVTERGRTFSVLPGDWRKWMFGVGCESAQVNVAGWVYGHEVERWEYIPKGSTNTHYHRTRTANRGVPASGLRDIEELPLTSRLNW